MNRSPLILVLSTALVLPLMGCPREDEPEDPVLEPSTLADVLEQDDRFGAFYAQLDGATLEELRGREAGTVLAPVNEAMAAIPDICFTRWQILEANGDGEPMQRFLRYHIDFDNVSLTRDDLAAIGALDEGVLAMSRGGDVNLEMDEGGRVTANGRSLGQPQITDNGYIHPVLGQALLPADLAEEVAAGCPD